MTAFLDISEWRRLLAQEEAAGKARFEQSRAHLDLGGRIGQGVAVGGLVVADAQAGRFGRTAWRLEKRDGPLGSEFSTGDPVRVFRKRAPEKAVRGLIIRARRQALTVVFDAPPEGALETAELVIEKEWDAHSHGRLLAGLAALEQAKKGRDAFWAELLCGRRAPSPAVAAPIEEDAALNPEQNVALARAMGAPEVFLVHGPPGTGKTEVLAAIAQAERRRGGQVLACAASNAAVDNLLLRLEARGVEPVRLGHPARVLPRAQERTLETLTQGTANAQVAERLSKEARALFQRADRASWQGRSADRFAQARQLRAEAKQLLSEARALARSAERDVLERADVVCATLTGLAQLPSERRFSLLIVDEATQATLPATALGLLRADRVVLAGDQHQLPPTVLSQEAAASGLSQTLYERLHAAHGEAISTMLEEQHRMNVEIMDFSNRHLYGGRLRAHPSVAAHRLLSWPPLLFVDTAGKGWEETRAPGGESLQNEGEAARVAQEVGALLDSGVDPGEIGVIAPYAAQVALLRSLLPEDPLEIDSVDAFQGREKDAIVLSLVRSNDRGELGFLSDVRRLNVALTRARRRLVLIGDSATLGAHPFYDALIQHAQASGAYRSVWEE